MDLLKYARLPTGAVAEAERLKIENMLLELENMRLRGLIEGKTVFVKDAPEFIDDETGLNGPLFEVELKLDQLPTTKVDVDAVFEGL